MSILSRIASLLYLFVLYSLSTLLSAEVRKILLGEVGDVSVLTNDVGLSHAHVYIGALCEELCRTCGVLEDEQRHDDVAGHVVEAACEEVVCLLVLSLLHVLHSLLVQLHHLHYASLQRLQLLCHFLLKHLLDDAEVSAVRDVADGSHNLQLCGSLIDREDAGVAIEALALIPMMKPEPPCT